jgi:hypothetical protein
VIAPEMEEKMFPRLQQATVEGTTAKADSKGGQPAVEGGCPYSCCDDNPRGGTIVEVARPHGTLMFSGNGFARGREGLQQMS